MGAKVKIVNRLTNKYKLVAAEINLLFHLAGKGVLISGMILNNHLYDDEFALLRIKQDHFFDRIFTDFTKCAAFERVHQAIISRAVDSF